MGWKWPGGGREGLAVQWESPAGRGGRRAGGGLGGGSLAGMEAGSLGIMVRTSADVGGSRVRPQGGQEAGRERRVCWGREEGAASSACGAFAEAFSRNSLGLWPHSAFGFVNCFLARVRGFKQW